MANKKAIGLTIGGLASLVIGVEITKYCGQNPAELITFPLEFVYDSCRETIAMIKGSSIDNIIGTFRYYGTKVGDNFIANPLGYGFSYLGGGLVAKGLTHLKKKRVKR